VKQAAAKESEAAWLLIRLGGGGFIFDEIMS